MSSDNLPEKVQNREDWRVTSTAEGEVRSREQIRSMDTPVLWSQDELISRKIVYAGMRQRELLNAFREVRFRLLKKTKTDNVVVLVSSLTDGGGGSLVSFNLAATFALDSHKTALYVDCNPYRSCGEDYVVGPIDTSLTHYLSDYSASVERVIHPSGIERLRVIPAGDIHDSAAELFNSKRMEVLIAEIKSRYPDRFIVLDAPSLESSTEARILAQYCDAAMVVAPFGNTTEGQLASALDSIGREKFAGFIFNY